MSAMSELDAELKLYWEPFAARCCITAERCPMGIGH